MAADRIRFSEEDINTIIKNLKSVHTSLSNAAGGLRGIGITRSSGSEVRMSGSATVSDVIAKNCSLLNHLGQDTDDLRSSVSRVRDLFLSMERELSGMKNSDGAVPVLSLDKDGNYGIKVNNVFADISKHMKEWRNQQEEKRKKLAETSEIYDDKGLYGGQQHGPYYDYDRYALYAEIVNRNTNGNYNAKTIETYLKKMKSEGCGYMAMVNTIFEAYTHKPEKFEETFGFPMINLKTGDFDFNRLLVEIYSSTDNHNMGKDGKDTYNKYEDQNFWKDGWKLSYNEKKDSSGSGTNMETRKYRLEKFMSEHGVTAKVENNVKITPKNFEEQSKKGSIIIRTGDPFYMYEEGSSKPMKYDGGHAMTVTGVDDQGRYIVSSWGKKYFIYPQGSEPDGKRCGYMEFQRCSYDI